MPDSQSITQLYSPKRGRALFGCDPKKYARVRSDDPNRPALVIDFLTARPPQHEANVPSHVARVLESLPKAWTSELEAIARWGLTDSVQAAVTLALQAATMATKTKRIGLVLFYQVRYP
ncbi:hypothetical protein OROGR_027996 [Orobanche gracilis]